MYQDTIAAISTPPGEGGIGIVRLSGSQAHSIARTLFRGELADRRLSYGRIIDTATDEVVDEVLVAYMMAPRTYTREDVVEINCHGGPAPLQRILQLTLRHGARLARPGEFTLRAFLNGRIDLAQAESVLDIVRARTEASLRLGLQGLQGHLSAPIKDIRAELMSVLAHLTAGIDFPEDGVEPQEVATRISEALDTLRKLIATSGAGMVYRLGVRTAIVGRPNVGKSSLLNRLLRQDRSIVTAVPGTTRDTVEEVASIGGVPFILVDTAGIVHCRDTVESMGVERSRRAIEQADFVLALVDVSQPMAKADSEILGLFGDKSSLVVANKCDLTHRAELSGLGRRVVLTSALTGQGINELEEKMVSTVLGGKVIVSDAPLVGNPRHREALERAARSLESALKAIADGMADDFVTIDLTAALTALGEITGETVHEDLLETIFSNFCIGK